MLFLFCCLCVTKMLNHRQSLDDTFGIKIICKCTYKKNNSFTSTTVPYDFVVLKIIIIQNYYIVFLAEYMLFNTT